MTCGKCQAELPPTAKFCPQCGTAVPQANVSGDRISVGNITGSKGIAIGRQAQATVTETGIGGNDLAQLFAAAYRQVDARPEHPDVDKVEIKQTVAKIQEEVAKGEQANPTKLQRWLKTLADVAPDVLDVTLTSLTNPALGVAKAVRLLVAQFQARTVAVESPHLLLDQLSEPR